MLDALKTHSKLGTKIACTYERLTKGKVKARKLLRDHPRIKKLKEEKATFNRVMRKKHKEFRADMLLHEKKFKEDTKDDVKFRGSLRAEHSRMFRKWDASYDRVSKMYDRITASDSA